MRKERWFQVVHDIAQEGAEGGLGGTVQRMVKEMGAR